MQIPTTGVNTARSRGDSPMATKTTSKTRKAASKTMQASSKTKKQKGKASAPRARKPALKVLVTRGSITQVSAPVIVVGAYKGITPTEGSALGAINSAIDQWVSRACDQGLIGADLGQVFFIPVPPQQIAAGSVLLAGMGDYGAFDYSDLRYLAMNVCYAVSALKMGSFSTVLIGSGEGNLKVDAAVRGLLSGICDALHHVEPDERIKRVEIVEYSETRYEEILQLVRQIEADQSIEHMRITVEQRKLRSVKGRARKGNAKASTSQPPTTRFVNRITIEHNGEGYSFSALTENAVVPVRQIEVQKFFTDGITKQLKICETEERQQQFGSLFHRYVFPQDFEKVIAGNQPLTLVVDSTSAGLPWEMACFGPKRNLTYFGLGLKLTRQFRTMLAGAPGIAPPLNTRLRILVIADPAPEPELKLAGAALEGKKVVEILNRFKAAYEKDPEWNITIEDRLGSDRCDPVEILELIVNGAFDIIHYSGHGVFDEKRPNYGGWVFGKDTVLSAREIFSAREVPRLVFANACFSAVCNNGEIPSPRASNRKLAGLAEAFFERGVQNYIGTGWEVNDAAAVRFAEVFYEKALSGAFLGDALADARRAIFNSGSTWGAYQHYGQSNARVV